MEIVHCIVKHFHSPQISQPIPHHLPPLKAAVREVEAHQNFRTNAQLRACYKCVKLVELNLSKGIRYAGRAAAVE